MAALSNQSVRTSTCGASSEPPSHGIRPSSCNGDLDNFGARVSGSSPSTTVVAAANVMHNCAGMSTSVNAGAGIMSRESIGCIKQPEAAGVMGMPAARASPTDTLPGELAHLDAIKQSPFAAPASLLPAPMKQTSAMGPPGRLVASALWSSGSGTQ